MLGLKNGTNALVDYDPEWPAEFARERQRLAAALDGVALGIEHYGSTAVPGMRAKPILDMLVGVSPLANWQLYRLPPGKLEEHVDRSAAVIISDVEAKCFHLYPSFFDRARREQQVVTFPDRLESIKQYVRNGGGLMMLGGWLSFSGAREMGGWRRSTRRPNAELARMLRSQRTSLRSSWANRSHSSIADPSARAAAQRPTSSRTKPASSRRRRQKPRVRRISTSVASVRQPSLTIE